MSHNSFGHLLRVTTWGESHGSAIGCVLDGCPPGIEITEAEIQTYLDKRRPGQSRYTTQRKEPDTVKIVSGVFEDDAGKQVTTGTPISLIIENVDQRSKDYSEIKDTFRPGHADFTYLEKYGIRDYRGGGRSSARETAMRVAAGAIARKIVPGLTVRAALVQLGPHTVNRDNWDWDQVDQNPFFSPDHESVQGWASYLDGIRKNGSSCGAVIEVVADGVPAGLGAPIYAKLDQDIASGLMSINAVKGVEIGGRHGRGGTHRRRERRRNPHRQGRKTGFPVEQCRRHTRRHLKLNSRVVARFAVKPTSSILTPRKTIDAHGNETEVSTKGRHDPCVGIRAVPIGEAMVALAIADHYLLHRAQTGKG